MSKVCLLVHGIGAGDRGEKGIGKLREYFEEKGYRCLVVPYGWFFLLRPWICNKSVARVIAAFTSLLVELGHTVVGLGHSNGAAILAQASRYGAPFSVLVFVNGALNRRPKIGKQVPMVLNYHAPGDEILLIAGILPVYPPWGMLGRKGFPADSDPRFWNFDMGAKEYGEDRVTSHKDVFHEGKIEVFAPIIRKGIEWALVADHWAERP